MASLDRNDLALLVAGVLLFVVALLAMGSDR